MRFSIEKKLDGTLARAGVLETPHGRIMTPAFAVVGTKATVKALSPRDVEELGAQVVLANTYHLYLQPGADLVKRAGGLGEFMQWEGPTITDSGGFQVFSLGAAFGQTVSKIAKAGSAPEEVDEPAGKLAKIDEDGVTFKSHLDGSEHRFTPESSIAVQEALGADIIFAFDECTSPSAPEAYQREAMERTHRWAKRSLDAHIKEDQALFGIVQGGRFRELREESARTIAKMGFDGFGIGGSFDKEDMYSVVGWVNSILPEEKPRHLLGIGEPSDLFGGVEHGADLFDCVAPTRIARNGTLYTMDGPLNILNARFKEDLSPIDAECDCSTCRTYTRAYLSHLFRAKEMFASTLASIHNLRFIVRLMGHIRLSILEGTFSELKGRFLTRYYKS
ncbi:tRNA guanosine(34) transglycosylase Tgt [Candidatus Parcubacteria bacterium]|nr:tRNA guanosine(34) transglycosylase Tgt [Candidatus Parcubacteria bacterium]